MGLDFSPLWESLKYPTATLSKYEAPKETLGMMGENEMGGIITFQCVCLQNICTPLKEFAFTHKSFAFVMELIWGGIAFVKTQCFSGECNAFANAKFFRGTQKFCKKVSI